MSSQTLPIARLIDVSVTLTTQAAQAQNLNALLFIGTSTIIDTVQRIRSYTTLAEVAADFGTSAPEYLAAVLWFEQSPQPQQFYIGRWVNTASSGELIGATLTAAQQLMSFWNAITTGSFQITVDGGGGESITGLNFSSAANMNGVAAVIQVAITGATIVWNSVYSRFVVTSNSTGTSSTVSFARAGAGGTDISGDLGLLSTSSGCYQAPGLAAETALACVTLMDSKFGQIWFAVVIPDTTDADQVSISEYIDGATNFHFLGVTTQEAGALVSGNTSNVGYLLQQVGTIRYMIQYSSTNAYAVVSALARILTTDYTGNNTVITLMYKQAPGIIAENLNETQITALEGFAINVFVAYNDNTAIIEPGVAGAGQYVDTVIGAEALAVLIQTALYNVLYTSPTKVPQTDAGTQLLVTAIAAVCAQFVNNGLLAPGIWNGTSFGSLAQGQQMDKGYYIYAPPVSTQSEASRAKRISVPIQIAAKLAGACQYVDASITVNS